jgi:quercetin dioxygenase-like cupin family protein
MDIKRSGSEPSRKGSADWFTGSVRIDPMFQAPEPARVSGGHVTFEPGARTAWHTHPLGQTLIITSGLGWVQREGSPIEEVLPGDIVWFPPGEKHWHGASASAAMTHIAIQEMLNGKNVEWLEKSQGRAISALSRLLEIEVGDDRKHRGTGGREHRS